MSSLSFFLAFVLHAGEWNIELEIFYAGFVFSLLYSVCNVDGLVSSHTSWAIRRGKFKLSLGELSQRRMQFSPVTLTLAFAAPHF